jgi:hypothetical protein
MAGMNKRVANATVAFAPGKNREPAKDLTTDRCFIARRDLVGTDLFKL